MRKYYKKIFFSCFVFLWSQFIYAQINLVKNPSFEMYASCPRLQSEIKFANFWSSPGDTIPYSVDSINYSSCPPDYCNSCGGVTSLLDVPSGVQYHHYARTGGGMADVFMFTNQRILDSTIANSTLRTYLQGRLYDTLVSGTSYCVTFYVSPDKFSAWFINHIGAYIDNGTIDTTNRCGWPQVAHVPQVYTDSIITGTEHDSVNWYKIEGSFVAGGGESFITIGNFFDSAHTDKLWTGFIWAAGHGNTLYSSYLVDDVSVIAADAVAVAGTSVTVPTTYIDSIQVGDTTGYLPCYWYKRLYSSGTWVLIDSNTAGFKVHPDSSTWYKMELTVCGHTTYDSMKITVGNVGASIVQFAGLCTFPNPASKEFNIEGIKNYSVRVIDIVGREVLAYTHVAGNLKIPVGELERGMYFVEVVDVETGIRVVRKMVRSEHD